MARDFKELEERMSPAKRWKAAGAYWTHPAQHAESQSGVASAGHQARSGDRCLNGKVLRGIGATLQGI